ncbi:hypothetical protein [Empedobacter brevis]|uniref:hypothetical protein n=1 Tax=Empedobacter brevis TaxID=247 RepID=UPI002898BCFA|nr:hypothetical protein [Empedobacter brevis]
MALENKEQIYTEKSTLKNWFSSKLKPTQGQFWAWMDSYWHKGEKLPIHTIDGLGEVVDGKAPLVHYHEQYATNDATSLSAENITQWKKKLDVDNLQFDDRAISLTGEYTDFGLNHTSKQSQFNEAMYASNQTKLNEPTSEGTEEEYPFLIGIDEDGYSAKLPAGDLGKNFANADLEVTENRKHTGTASVEFAMPLACSNSNVLYSGLVDKSSDVMYNIFPVLDSNGNLAKATAIGNALESGLKNVSADQGLRISQLLNGGQGSSGAMSVNRISPPLIQNRFNSVEYILLRGANVNLSPLSRKIEILKSSDNSLVVTIPDNQIIDLGNGIDLTFYYNFYNFPLGDYKIRLTSGSKVYTTDLTLKIVEQVEDINTNSIVWEKVEKENGAISPDSSAIGSSFVLSPLVSTNGTVPILSFKSSEIFAQGEDFYLEMRINLPLNPSNGQTTNSSTRMNIGIGYSNTPNSLVNKNLLFTQAYLYSVQGVGYTNNSQRVREDFGPFSYSVIFIKTGNLFRTIVDNVTQQATLSNNSGYSIFLEMPSFSRNYTIQGQIIKAFKFS